MGNNTNPKMSTSKGEFTATFRQHKADSHCQFLHSYRFNVAVEHETNYSVKSELNTLCQYLDGKLLVADDDPKKRDIMKLGDGMFEGIVVVPATGCEKTAEFIKTQLSSINPFFKIWQVTVHEHGANFGVA